MSSKKLENFKNSIKPDLLEKFDKNQMVSSGFIPVDIRKNELYIIIKKSVANKKPEIESTVKSGCQNETCVAKFISLADEEFEELFKSLDSSAATVSEEKPKVDRQQFLKNSMQLTQSVVIDGTCSCLVSAINPGLFQIPLLEYPGVSREC